MNRWRRFLTVGLLLLLLDGGGFCRGQEEYAAGILDREAVLRSAVDVSPEVYPDAEEVLLAGTLKVRYEADGTYTQWYEEFVKILTEEARRRHSVVSTHFTIPYQRGPEDCAIPLLEIIRTEGMASLIDVAAQSRIMVDPSSMADNIYNPNDKIIRVNVPGLNVGDILHFVMFDRIVQPRMKDTWAEWSVLESTRPMIRYILDIDAPLASPLRSMALKDEIPGTVTHRHTEDGDRMLYHWEISNVPRMFPEPNMPPLHTVVQRLLVSTVPDWETISRWYWNLSEPHFAATPAIEEKVRELTQGLEDPDERIRPVFSFVAQDIRYMGITVEATAPGYEPHDVKETFEARHGVCRDKAALLVAMLRLAGLDAFPTLIHNGPKKDPEVPQPYFNHAIVAVREADGHYLLMDPTPETAVELLPAYLNDKSFLVATPEGEGLKTSPINPAEANMMRIETTGAVDAAGNLQAETVFRFNGVNDDIYRGHFARSRPEDRRRLFEGLVKRTAPGARLESLAFSPDDMMDVSTTLTVRASFEADDILVRGSDLALMSLPAFGTRVGMVNYIIGRTGLKERRYPLVTDMACGVRETVELDMDPSLNTLEAVPASPALDDPRMSWSLGMQQAEGRFRAEADFRLKAVEFAPAEYLGLKAALQEIELAMRKMPVFALKTGKDETLSGAESVVLSNTVVVVLQDAGRWTETHKVCRRILSYAGKKRYAELKLTFNTGVENVILDRAVVTGEDGTTHEIRDEEINLMDAPWVGSAARYPPTRTLVAAFPAVEVGSLVEYAYTRTVTNRPFFAMHQSYAGADPVRQKIVQVHVPSGLPLRVHRARVQGAVDENVTQDDAQGMTIYAWSAQDVAPVKQEESLPPWWAFTPTTFVSTVDWGEYSTRLYRVLRAAAARQRRAERLARELTRGEKDAWKKLEAIRDFVAVHVRQAGPDLHGLPFSSITRADETLSDGYGNSTDRAVVLFAMLRAAKFKPQFVLASSLPAIDRFRATVCDAADPHFFSRLLVRVQDRRLGLPEGRCVYLNDTDQYAAVGTSPHEGGLALALPEGRIEEILPARPGQWEIQYEMEVTAQGDTDLTRRRLVYGAEFGEENQRFTEMTPEERKRYYQELIAGVSQAAEAKGDLITDFSGYPGVVEFSVHIPQYAVRDGEFLYFTFPDSLEGLLPVRSDTRVNPLYIGSRYCGRLNMRARIPEDFAVEIQAASLDKKDVAGGRIEVRQAAMLETGKAPADRWVVLEAEAGYTPAVIEPGRYAELLDLRQSVAHKRARTTVLRKKE